LFPHSYSSCIFRRALPAGARGAEDDLVSWQGAKTHEKRLAEDGEGCKPEAAAEGGKKDPRQEAKSDGEAAVRLGRNSGRRAGQAPC
jgi:hypothetical protein